MTELGRFESVDLRKAWKTEGQDFTPWLAQNLSVLADTLDMELELEALETNIGPFRADILCKNADGGAWVLIENQLERTDHNHLGQLLTYAAGLNAVTICWIAERFTEEHRATLDWLNEITNERFRFFGLEVELLRIIGTSPVAPRFNIVSKPNAWSRSVKPVDVTPLKQLQKEFWSALMQRLDERKSPIRSKTPQPQSWMAFSIGKAGFYLEARLHSPKKWIAVHLVIQEPNAAAHYALLERQREEINRDFGEDLEWRPSSKKKEQLRLRRTNADSTQRENWPDQITWMVSTLETFDRTFRQRLKSLDASDWQAVDGGADD